MSLETDALKSDLDFYKYIKDLSPEMRWAEDELLIFLYYSQLEDFIKLWAGHPSVFDDGGIKAHMQEYYIVFDIAYMLEYVGINPEAILEKGKELE